MIKSLFGEFVEKYFSGIVGKITEKFNGKTKEPTLLHKTMLTEEYSPDLSWGASEFDHSIVAADVVSTNSSLPLKSRSKIATAKGKLPKIGIKFPKDEDDIDSINTMRAKGVKEAEVANKIFDDVPRAIKGVDIRKEIMFQEGLSTGATLVLDEDNVGTGIRADYGYKDDHKFICTTAAWGDAKATPQDDVQQLFDKAEEDGNSIEHVYLSKKYFNLFRKSEQGRLLAAQAKDVVITDKALLPVPSRSLFLEALADEYGATFHIVSGSFKVELPNGDKKSITPWAQPNVVGVPSETIGRLVWGTLAEETNPVAGVTYQKSGSHTLVSKYSVNEPALAEFTAAQARAIPVIDGADGIYMLEADKAPAAAADPVDNADPKQPEGKE